MMSPPNPNVAPAWGVGPPPNPTGRPTLRRWLVVAALVVAFLLGALLVAVAVGAEVGVQEGLVALVVAVVPVGIVIPSFLWLDRYEAEPRSSLLFAFGWGACVATAVSLVVNSGTVFVLEQLGRDGDVLGAVAVAPIVEETTKGFGVLVLFWLRRREFDGLVDGVVYGGLVGAGFAFAENILYFGRAFLEAGSEGLLVTFVVRGLLGPFAHPLFTLWTGIGIGVAVTGRGAARYLAPAAGLLLAMVLHGLWNYSAVVGASGWLTLYLMLQVPLFVATIVLVLWMRRREGRLVARHLDTYAAHGLFTPAEVVMLSSLSHRRAARDWAQRVGGRPARKAMLALHDEATELAFLRARIERGTAGPDAADEERRLIEAIRDCRARLP